jgi:N-methylhydantoinase A
VEPTVTDANVVLGRINPNSRMNGDGNPLDVQGAQKAVTDLGSQLGLSMEETAEAILAVVNQRMAGRMRLMSIERGLDPRDFALVAFGGAGPLHGAALIKEVGVSTMLVPLYPGVLCALGCVYADLRYNLSQTLEKRVDLLKAGELNAIYELQRARGLAQLKDSQVPIDQHTVSHKADMAYAGQIHALSVDVEANWGAQRLSTAFQQAYQEKFGNVLDGIPAMIVNVRTVVIGTRTASAMPQAVAIGESGEAVPVNKRRVHFGKSWHDTPIFDRKDLRPGMSIHGPAIIEQSDTTTVIEPDMGLSVDNQGNLLVRMN